ncbi:hypothetical protein SUGI_1151810 [Cryptomeria japonica]|nr:hypothetical protein SUGI_1151810 [Cryptomeria japonica]
MIKVYTGVVGSGIAYCVQEVCMRIKGLLFVIAFIPLTMMISEIMDSLIVHQNIYLGSVVTGVVICNKYGMVFERQLKLSSNVFGRQ